MTDVDLQEKIRHNNLRIDDDPGGSEGSEGFRNCNVRRRVVNCNLRVHECMVDVVCNRDDEESINFQACECCFPRHILGKTFNCIRYDSCSAQHHTGP